MNAAFEYFSDLYIEIPKAILVYDASMNLVFNNAVAMAYREMELPAGLIRAAEKSMKEMRGTTYSLVQGGMDRNVFLIPAVLEGESYIALELELTPVFPELPGLIQALRNSQDKLASYLNGIYGVAQKLGLDTPDGKKIGEDVRRIMRMSEHLDRLFDSGRRIIYRVPMDMGQFVEEFLRSIKDLGLKSEVEVSLPAERAVARVMPEDLELVLTNLVTNALRFSVEHVSLQVKEKDGRIRITVADDGPGVPDPERVFECGYRTPDEKGAQGLGYTLTALKMILEQQDATISYERVKNQTCFHIDLPKSELPPHGRLAAWKAEPLTNSLSQLRVEMSDYMKEMGL